MACSLVNTQPKNQTPLYPVSVSTILGEASPVFPGRIHSMNWRIHVLCEHSLQRQRAEMILLDQFIPPKFESLQLPSGGENKVVKRGKD